MRPSIADPAGYVRANVAAGQAVLDHAGRLEVGRIVFASSSSVYGNAARVPFVEDQPVPAPVSPYAATKRAGELLCTVHHHLYGGSVLCLRCFTVYGPRQRPDLAIRKFCTLLAAGRPIPLFGDRSPARDYTWIMARTPTIPHADYDALLARVRQLGYSLSDIRKVPQAGPQPHP